MILSSLIERAYVNNGVITTYIYGDLGAGKASYALWTAYEVLGDWRQVLKHVFFRPEEAAQAMRKAIDRAKIEGVGFDDMLNSRVLSSTS